MFKREEKQDQALKAVKVGGYLVLLSILLSVIFGVYTILFNPMIFANFIGISGYESRIFFLGVYLPSLVVIVAIGYIFATTPRLENLNLWHMASLCSLVILCLALSALSIFNILSFFGAIIILVAVVSAQTKPTFKALWKREACFLVEFGTVLTASSSLLFLLMFIISLFLQTYSVGATDLVHLVLLTVAEALSLTVFLLTVGMGLHGKNMFLYGAISLIAGTASFIITIQNTYLYFNLQGRQGVLLSIIGTILTFFGVAIYFKLALSEFLLTPTVEPSFIYKGKYCPFCGALWTNIKKDHCSFCGNNLFGTSPKAFCFHCGRLVAGDTRNCPHCLQRLGSLPVFISHLIEESEEKIPEKEAPPGRAQIIWDSFLERLKKVLIRLDLSQKEFLYMGILTVVLIFVSMIIHVRVEMTAKPDPRPYPRYEEWRFFYGYPLEWLELLRLRIYWFSNINDIRISWTALLVDLFLYSLSSLAIVYIATRLYSKIRESK